MKVADNRPGFLGQSIIIFLLIFDATLLFLSVFFTLKPSTLNIIVLFDLIISIILFAIYLWAIYKADDKKTSIKNNWALIFSLIPIYFLAINLGLTEQVFILKFLNIVKIISLYLFAQKFSRDVMRYQEKTRLVYALATFLVVLVFCSLVFFAAEHVVNPQVKTYEDSIWFVLQTITTVGYGDIIPITDIGKVMGIISMLSALILTSIITSVATFSLIEKFRKGTENASIRAQEKIEDLDKKLDGVNHQLVEMDNSDEISDIKRELQDLKTDISDIKEYVHKEK
jgi:voltage-gated potassium channel